MARSTRTFVGQDVMIAPGDSKKHMAKIEFGRRLERLMSAKFWRQADLAREAGLNRDAVSTYVNGKSYPSPVNLKKLADALGVGEVDLLPNHIENAIDASTVPSFELKIAPEAPHIAWVRINRAMPTSIALEIARLIGETEKHVLDRTGSGEAAEMHNA